MSCLMIVQEEVQELKNKVNDLKKSKRDEEGKVSALQGDKRTLSSKIEQLSGEYEEKEVAYREYCARFQIIHVF